MGERACGGSTNLIGRYVVFVEGEEKGCNGEIVGIDCCTWSFLIAMMDGPDAGKINGSKGWGHIRLIEYYAEDESS